MCIAYGTTVAGSSIRGGVSTTTPRPSATVAETALPSCDISQGNWKEIALEEFETWIESSDLDINALRICGSSLLSIAAREDRLDIAELLICSGANVEQETLVPAVVNGDMDMVKLLLRNGADINRIEDNGTTALSAAVHASSVDLVNFLIGEGAEVDRGDGVALAVAAWGGNIEILDILVRNGADVNLAGLGEHPLQIAAWSDADHREKVYQFLVHSGANVNHTNQRGRGGLAAAAIRGRCDIIEMYLRYGADIHIVDKSGQTLLLMAAKARRADVVKFLIETGGVDVEVVDNQGRNALNIARRDLSQKPTNEGYLTIVRLIEDAIAEKANMYVLK